MRLHIDRSSSRLGLDPLSRATAAWLAVGFAAVAGYFLLSGGVQDVAYEVIGAGAVGAVYVGIGRMSPRVRFAWHFFGAGLALQVVGDCVSTYYEVVFGHEAPVPSASDVFYIAGYPLYAIGILLLLRELGGHLTRAAVLDAVIIFVAVATVQWVFVLEPALHMATKTSTLIVKEAYPSMDVLLLVALLQLVIGPSSRVVPYRLLIASVALTIVGDEVFMLGSSYTPGGTLDLCYLSAYVLWGAAALQPSAPVSPMLDRRAIPRLTQIRMAVLGAALLSVPVSLLIEHFDPGRKPHTPAAAIGTALIAVLVLLRLGGLLRAVEGQNLQLRQLDQLKDEFVASVSHELRTPLTSISGYVELLDDAATGELTAEQQGFVTIVSRNTQRLLKVVNDLLFFSGMQDGRLELDIQEVDLARLASDAVEVSLPVAAAKGLSLGCGCTTPARVAGDPSRLAQMLDNLVSNAIKFTPPGGRVTVQTSSDGDVATLEVVDSGIGIPAGEQTQLFERFFRSSNALSEAIPGTGLGLYITKAIAEAHGGWIEVESAEGQGTVFRIRLRVAAASALRAADAAAEPRAQARRPAAPRT